MFYWFENNLNKTVKTYKSAHDFIKVLWGLNFILFFFNEFDSMVFTCRFLYNAMVVWLCQCQRYFYVAEIKCPNKSTWNVKSNYFSLHFKKNIAHCGGEDMTSGKDAMMAGAVHPHCLLFMQSRILQLRSGLFYNWNWCPNINEPNQDNPSQTSLVANLNLDMSRGLSPGWFLDSVKLTTYTDDHT